MDKQELISIYAEQGYVLAEVEPRSVVIVPEDGTLECRTSLQKLVDHNLKEYQMIRRGASQEDLKRAGFDYSIIKDISDEITSGERDIGRQRGVFLPFAKIPETEKYIILDPHMPHWILAYHLACRQIPSIIFTGDKPLREYSIHDRRWNRYPSMLYDEDVDEATKTSMAKKLIDDLIEQYRKGNVVLDFEKPDKLDDLR
ncbi:hypothetical protein J4219_00630 [Candidatus Woesearchaeota archaeon]|nr:hypothetical protein [Candidatus Woesearchaeota archaeon]